MLLLLIIAAMGTAVFAEGEKVITLDDVFKNVGNSPTLKQFDIGYDKLVNSDEKIKEDSITIGIFPQDTDASFLGILLGKLEKGKHLIVYYAGKPIYTYFPYSYFLNGRDIYAKSNLVPYRISSQLALIPKNKELSKKTLELSAAEVYFNILLTQESIKLQQELVDATKDQLDVSQQKYDKGTFNKKALDQLKLQYEQAQIKLRTQKRSQGNLVLTLNKLMNVPLSTTYDRFDGEVKYQPIEINIEESVEKAVSERYEVLSAKEDLDFKNLEYDLAKKYKNNNTYIKHELVKEQQKQAELKLEKTIEDIKLEITYAYETIKNNYTKIKNDEIALKSAETKYNLMKEKYNAGQITYDMLNMAHVEVSAAKIQLLSDINKYNISLKRFDSAAGLGPAFIY